MPNVDIRELNERCNTFLSDIAYRERRAQEKAQAMYEIACKATEQHLANVEREIDPTVRVAFSYTKEQLQANANGEIEHLQRVFNNLVNYLDRMVPHYKDGL